MPNVLPPAEAPSYYVPPPPNAGAPGFSQAPPQPYYQPGPMGPGPVGPPVKKRSRRKVLVTVLLVFVVLCGVGGIFVGTKIYQFSKNVSRGPGGYATPDPASTPLRTPSNSDAGPRPRPFFELLDIH